MNPPIAALVLALAAHAPASPRGSIECRVVLSADLDGVERWYGSDVPDFEIAGTERVVRGQPFLVYPFLQGCARDESGALDVTLDLRILRPDGSAYHEREDARAFSTDVTGDFLLAEDLVGVFFEPEDPLGTYRVEIVARDRVASTTARAQQEIELVEYAEGEPFADADAVWPWLWDYFHAPDPCRAAPALRAYARLGVDEITVVHGGLAELLQANAWLLPVLFEELADEREARALLLWLLSRTSHDPAPFVAELGPEERAAWERFAQVPNPVSDPLGGREDLNELLDRYTLGRGRAHIHRLVHALAPDSNDVVADTVLRDEERGIDIPLCAVMSRALAKELERYLPDPATRGYLAVLAKDDGLPDAVREALARILADEQRAGSGK